MQMWPGLIAKAKQGGLDVIQTYVFWNLHEPQPGKVRNQSLRLLRPCFVFIIYFKNMSFKQLYALLIMNQVKQVVRCTISYSYG